jgi:hypothetical protein
MTRSFVLLLGAGFAMIPATASAQWMPGAELAGQSVLVESNGVANTVHFDAGGAARIVTPRGSVIPASWSNGANGLCLNANGVQECWQYSTPLNAGQPMAMTSSCQAVSTWTAMNTNAPRPPEASAEGERG